jgi:hypothetical protein
MSSAESGQEIVQRNFVGNVIDGDRSGPALRLFGVKQVVRANSNADQIARFDAIGIMIVILPPDLRQS